MTEEQIKQKFKETYPDFMRGDEPLSPYFDIWEYAIEIATKELEAKIKHFTKHLEPQAMSALFEQVEEEVKQEQRIKELEAQLTKAKQIIKELLDTQSRLDPYRDIFKDRILKAEQFLKE